MQIDGSVLIGGISIVIATVGGVGAWMFRVDRMLTRLTVMNATEENMLESLSERNTEEHGYIWDKVNEHSRKLDDHGNRIIKMESSQ